MPIADAALDGYNGTIFAYGQTSSGKTHTMVGTDDELGVLLLAMADLFAKMAERDGAEHLVRVSYLEIYLEAIRDLLQPRPDAKLRIVDEPARGPTVPGLHEEVIVGRGAAPRVTSASATARTALRG